MFQSFRLDVLGPPRCKRIGWFIQHCNSNF